MSKYIGVKLVEAVKMSRGDYNEYRKWPEIQCDTQYDDGYMIKYRDGYISWSPKEVFENSYLQVDDNKDLASGVSIGPEMVEKFIHKIHATKIGDKTTLVRVVLVNGFELVEASSCVDPNNYDHEIGKEVCLSRIKNKIWSYLGFLLQTADAGFNPNNH